MNKTTDTTRFDYVRLRYSTDHDLAQHKARELDDLIALWRETNPNCKGGHEHRVFPGGSAYDRQYCIEIWGDLAEVVTWLDFEEYADRLMRLDVRTELPTLKESGVHALTGHFRAKKKGQHNVISYTSKARAKSRGRNAGGVGMALGSHKSTWRASAYKRAREAGAIEFQNSGDFLAKCVSTTISRRAIAEVDAAPWDALRAHIRVQGIQKLERAAGLDYGEVLALLSGAPAHERPLVWEQTCFDIEVGFRGLPADVQQQVLDKLHSVRSF